MKKLIKKNTPKFLLESYRNYKRKRLMSHHQGDKVVCPICNSHFNEFAPYGVILRDNAKCPKCYSLERHRLLWMYIVEKTNLFSNEQTTKLLHFAPQKVFYDQFVNNRNIDYTPCDLFPEMYDYRGQVRIQKVDILNIQFESDYFDAVICNHVLEHVEDDKIALAELYRVMKKGAWAILQVPIDYTKATTYEDPSITDPSEREAAFGQFDHLRLYGRDYKDRLASVGFKVTEDDFVKSFSEEDLFKYGLNPTELIYFCQK